MALMVLMAGSTFIGVAFQPWYWLFFASSFCLSEYVRRAMAPVRPVGVFVPAAGQAPAGGPAGAMSGLPARRA
jgi:hypothetical protein